MEPRSDPDGTLEFELIGMRHSSCEKETYSVIFCISPTSFFNCFKMVAPQLYINVFIIIVHMSGVNTNICLLIQMERGKERALPGVL